MPDQLMMDTKFASAKISVGSDISYGTSNSPDLLNLNSAEERNYQQVINNIEIVLVK